MTQRHEGEDMSDRRHEILIPKWHPIPLNKLLGHWAQRHRLKKTDADLVAGYARQAGVPRATGRRRVSLRLTLGPGQRAADPDAYFKSTLDALTRAGLLVDDNRQGVEIGEVTFERGVEPSTAIGLVDLDAPHAAGERQAPPAAPGDSRAAGAESGAGRGT
jgi:hypothetical protein